MHRTAWYVTPTLTLTGDYLTHKTPTESLANLGQFLIRIAGAISRAKATEGLVLVDDDAAGQLYWHAHRRPVALDSATAAGWRHTKPGTFTAFFADGRPTVHLARLSEIQATAEREPAVWPFAAEWMSDTVSALSHWHRLTGVPWQAGPAVMGLELMHKTIAPYRFVDRGGKRKQATVAKHDDGTPGEAGVSMWSPDMWRRDELAAHEHSYDRRRAGLTAAGCAKLAVTKLVRGWRKYDPARAGWWQVSRPAWNMAELPHPFGPGGRPGTHQWVTTADMDLAAELAAEGLLAMPEVIDSMTGAARTALNPWQQLIERTYADPATPDYADEARELVQAAAKESATRGLGMLAKADGNATIWRPDWYHAVNATKRANMWRLAYKIGRGEGRWPLYFDDDRIAYASDDPDPETAAPTTVNARTGLPLINLADVPGGFRVQLDDKAAA